MKNLRSGLLKNYSFVTLAFALLAFNLSEAMAQLDPSSWQAGATGLRTTHAGAGGKTAGLTATINTTGTTPFITVSGGLRQGYGKLWGPTGIELGQIKIPGIDTYSLLSETVDWAHNELSFSDGLKIWVSRLTPAVLIQNTSSNALRLFSGNLNGATLVPGSSVGQPWNPVVAQNRTPVPAYPKYIAYQSGGNIYVEPLSATDLILPVLENNWVIVWYGINSHFIDTKTHLSYSNNVGGGGAGSPSLPYADSYQADVPILIKFQNTPTSIRHSPEGGIDLSFTATVGNISFMPLFGRERLKAADTEGWGTSASLPQTIQAKVNFWVTSNRLCSYPAQVTESYGYNSATDISTITENITYSSVCPGGSTTSGFAILPPILSLAMFTPDQGGQTNPLNIQVNKAIVNSFYPTDFGPVYGIDNTKSYSWSVSNLKRYTDNKRILTNTAAAPPELTQELSSEIQKVISAGHYKPWIMTDETPTNDNRGAIYFLNPADVLYQLSEIIGGLPASVEKDNLIDYLKNERSTYPPETVYNLPDAGTIRGPFALNQYDRWKSSGSPGNFLSRAPLYNFYALGRFYELTGEAVPASTLSQAKTILEAEMKEQDFASFSWFRESAATRPAVALTSSNRHLAGLIGFIKLAKLSGDLEAENLGRSLLAKSAVQRLAFAKYPRYLYSTGLNMVPSNKDWMPVYLALLWRGYLFNYNWTNPYDDPLQVMMMNQFGAYLHDQAGYTEPGSAGRDWGYVVSTHLGTYKDTVPEVYRFLSDYAKPDSEIFLNRFTQFSPNWFAAFQEAALGQEHNLSHPLDSYQLFMAKALLQKDTPQNLEKYLDISWLDSGDFFYMHKLAETIKAYQGWKWEDEVISPGLTGDVNQDALVNVLDVQACVNHILGIQNLGDSADVNQDGSVDVLDVQVIVNLILGV